MNSFNDEVCEFNSTPITENFSKCEWWLVPDDTCPSGCRESNIGQQLFRSSMPAKCAP